MMAATHLLFDPETHAIGPLPNDIGHWPEADCYCAPREAVINVTVSQFGQPIGTITQWIHVR